MAHQAIDDYQAMNFEFPNENIILVIDYEELGPYEGPEVGFRWTMVFDEASNTLGNEIGVVIISPRVVIHPSLPDFALTAPIIWLNMKRASWVLKLLLT